MQFQKFFPPYSLSEPPSPRRPDTHDRQLGTLAADKSVGGSNTKIAHCARLIWMFPSRWCLKSLSDTLNPCLSFFAKLFYSGDLSSIASMLTPVSAAFPSPFFQLVFHFLISFSLSHFLFFFLVELIVYRAIHGAYDSVIKTSSRPHPTSHFPQHSSHFPQSF